MRRIEYTHTKATSYTHTIMLEGGMLVVMLWPKQTHNHYNYTVTFNGALLWSSHSDLWYVTTQGHINKMVADLLFCLDRMAWADQTVNSRNFLLSSDSALLDVWIDSQRG